MGSLDSAKRLADSRGCAAELDLDALLARDDVDVVTVCVPSGLHAEVGVAAAAAGKHLIVEKPIDLTLAAADRLIDVARIADVKLTVISQHRFDPGPVELRRLISGGALGPLLLGEASTKRYRSQAYYDSGTWRGIWALDGGSLMNQGVHYVDLLLACMGPVAEVTAISATQTHQIEVEDVALALLRFRSGAVGTIVSSTSVYPGLAQRLEISGTKGTVVIERGREPSATALDGRAALEVVLAVYESARERPHRQALLGGLVTFVLSGFADEISPDPAEQLATLAAESITHLELRSAWGTNVADFSDAQLASFRTALAGAGVSVSAIGSPIGKIDIRAAFRPELDRMRRIADIADALGTGVVRVFSFFIPESEPPEAYRSQVIDQMAALAAVAAERGLVLAHENEKLIYERRAAAVRGHHHLGRIARAAGEVRRG